MKELGKLLKELREASGMSLMEVYKATGLHNSTVSRLEREESPEPPAKNLKKLADLYHADVIQLYLACGYLTADDLQNYTRCFEDVDLLTDEEHSLIQKEIQLFGKKRGENSGV